jgi:hydrogen peroxide-dependent heme synthase
MANPIEPPATLEGWYVLHDAWRLDWPRWLALSPTERQHRAEELTSWLAKTKPGSTAVYAVVGQKADLLFLHYRQTVVDLHAAAQALQRLAIAEELSPAGSFVSVIEASLYELTAMARAAVARRGIEPGTPGFGAALEAETAAARAALDQRLFRTIPEQSHLCWYPMNKRRTGTDNWYTMTLEERRNLMRGHGKVGHEFASQVTQVVSGAIGLDDWEWGVDLHSDDPLTFKKLVTAMRYDEASARFADFGPFVIGLRQDTAALTKLLLA